MNASDFEIIEYQLNIELPNIFKQFMSSFPNDTSHQLQNDCDAIACNGELFTISHLRNMHNVSVDYYELQPELKPRRFIRIGGDGFGNYYFMVGNDRNSNELWFWEHDPYDGFSRCDKTSLTNYLEQGGWELTECTDPFLTTTGLFVARTNHPVRAILNPITLDEWTQYLRQHNNLELDENFIGKNPFTKEEVVFRRWPGRAKVTIEGAPHHFSYIHGAISLGVGTTPELMEYAERIAKDLNALVWYEN